MNEVIFAKRRMYRIFDEDGRSLVVAMDHGIGLDVYPALTDPPRVLDAVIAGGADAILTTPGVASVFPHHLKSVGLILRMDGGTSQLGSEFDEYHLLSSVEDALRLGADAVACMGFPGTAQESLTLGNVGKLASQCQSWGVPLMVEVIPGGFSNFDLRTAENIRLAARIGVELGADLIKTEFSGSAESFQQVTENCYRPVLVLGGSKKNDDRALLTMVRSALDGGAAGVVIGRNVWGHTHPQALVEALNDVVHHNASVEEALERLASAQG